MGAVPIVVASTLLYATVRYNVLKGVAWCEWPTYVANKAAALSALLLIVLSLRRGLPSDDEARLRRTAAWLVALHGVLSLGLLGPATYPRYFVDGKPTAAAAWSLLAGALSAVVMLRGLPADGSGSSSTRWRLGLLAFVPGVHAALLGYESWFAPATWPGYLVPITLLAFVAGAVGLALAARRA